MITAMLRKTAETNPRGTAVVCGDRELDYHALHTRVAGFAGGLLELGVTRGDHVLLLLPNCPEFVIAYFATAWVGATVQAVDPALPDHELRDHVARTPPAVVVTTGRRASGLARLLPPACRVVATGDGPATRFDDVAATAAPPPPEDDAAGAALPWVTTSTSGTEGEAKVIARSQANQVAEAGNIATGSGLTAADVVLCPVPLFHALGQFCCMITAVRAGAALVLLDHGRPDPVAHQVVEAVADRRATVLLGVPYLFEALVGLPPDAPADFSSLRLCMSGSNFMSPAVPERFGARFGVPLRQTYGSTETGSVSWDLGPVPTPESVGRPLPGVTVLVLDDDGTPTSPGAVGEIAVAGAAVATGGGPHRTGDLGRVDGAGRLYVVGRKRLLVDTGGHKVNPVEVEDVLKEHGDVADAAVVGLPLPEGGAVLVAAVVPARADVDGKALVGHCATHLAPHKVPRRVEFVAEIPRGAVGKVRRAHLTALLTTTGRDRTDELLSRDRLRTAPRPERTARLTRYLSERLADLVGDPAATAPATSPNTPRTPPGTDSPDTPPTTPGTAPPTRTAPSTSLAALGVDSLAALRLRMAVRNDLGVRVELLELLGAPGITALAELLSDRLAAPSASAAAVVRGPSAGEFPLSANQLSMWHAEQINPDTGVYVVAFAARLTAPCDIDALRRACQLLVDRHPALRTTFPLRDGAPVQHVAERAVVDFAVVGTPPGGARAALEEDAFRDFDITSAPPMRVRLYPSADGPLLLISQHHLITDYWSLMVLLRELAICYAAETSGAEPYLPAPHHTYTDYGRWLDEAASTPTGQDALAWWLDALRPPPPPADLPTDRPRPVVRAQRGALLRDRLPDDVAAAVRACAGTHGTTPYAVLLAAFHVVLHAHTGNADSAVAVNSANRDLPEFADVLGCFTNPVAHRVAIDPDESFADLLRRVSATLLSALDRHPVTLEQLLPRLGVPRDRGRAPLLEVGFGQNKTQDPVGDSFPAAGDGRVRLGGLVLEPLPLGKRGVVFDLSGVVHESGGSPEIAWEYDRDLFDEETVRRLVGRFTSVVRRGAADAGTAVRDLSTPADERELLLAAARGEPLPEPLPSVIGSIRAHADARSDAPAVEQDGDVRTFGELSAHADRVAGQVARGSRVVVWVGGAADLAAAGLGVLRAGACCAPLDGTATPEEVRAATAAARALVTTRELRDRLGPVAVPVVCVDDEWSGRAPIGVPAGRTPALVVRTSGVTGPPREVVVDHHALAVAAHHRVGPATPGEVLVPTGRSAGRLLADLLVVLAGGDAAVVAPPDVVGTGRAFTSAVLTPTELRHVVDGLDRTAATPAVDVLVVSGEVLTAGLVDRWRAHAPGGEVVHRYGGVGIGPAVAQGPVPPGAGGVVPVGRPCADVRCYVLDDAGRLCPVGVPGEVCVAVAGTPPADGRATPEPGRPGGWVLRTGDVGRTLPDGTLAVLGRAEQLRAGPGGYRRDPVRVEEALHAHPGVRLAVVLSTPAGVEAHVEPADPAVTRQELTAALRDALPAHLLPDAVVLTDRAPRAGDGKAARWSAVAAAQEEHEETPTTPVAEALAEIWAEVLGVDSVGPDDDYYALGGDSVMTIRIAKKAAERGIQLTRRQMFTHPTVRALAGVAKRGGPTTLHRVLSQRRAIPLTPVQSWFFDQGLTSVAHWNQAVAVEVAGPVDPARLRAALADVAAHHDAFRLRFRRGDDGWRQVGDPTAETIAVTEHDDPDPARVVAEVQRGIDIEAGPLLRAAVVRHAGTTRVLLVAHHLVVDFLSWQVFLDDLATAWEQRERGEPVRLPGVPLSYEQWARRLREHADSARVRAELPYWTRISGDPSDPEPTFEGQTSRVRRALSAEDTSAFMAALGDARPHEAVLACVVREVARECEQDVVRVDLEGHGREELPGDVDPSRTIGWFTALYPVAFPVAPDAPPPAVLADVRAELARVPGGGLGYGLLRYACSDAAVRERMAAIPRSAVSFNYLGRLGGLLGSPAARRGFRPTPAPEGHDRAPDNRRPYRWEFSAWPADGELVLDLAHAGSPEQADRLLERVLGALRDMGSATGGTR
ncbi:condensation domain-containing protein [Saccharothrix obliqua]|uniref:condensation domain-containing protein n=1 Tax=Saccharothrix obliqua TaxID=2861747 RepID=UPI001C5D9A4E|nr:condensation domain-containing protein [Saccharothrix obliqua]MBW4718811.1 AMP-binding protein [Saccharothrix obliqua]